MRPNNTDCPQQTAKYLEPLKNNEKYPSEVLIRGKDAEENKKIFDKLADIIKTAGVSWILHPLLWFDWLNLTAPINRTKSVSSQRTWPVPRVLS